MNWVVLLAFFMGMVLGAILLALVAAVYVSAEDDRRETGYRPWER